MIRGRPQAAFLPRPGSNQPDFDWCKQICWHEEMDGQIQAARDRGDEREALRLEAEFARCEGNHKVYWMLRRRLNREPIPPRGG